jgi:hypothetical protein
VLTAIRIPAARRSAWQTGIAGQVPFLAGRRRSGTRSEKAGRLSFRAASYSVFHFVYLPTPEPLDPGNAQAVPGINLPVDSQTYLRAKLVKQ